MSFQIPPAKNYQSPLNAVPTFWEREPVEGNMMIPCEIDWGVMGGTNNCVNLNLQNNATKNFSQIVAFAVDNSACGSDVQFIFPDTMETFTVPAYTPKLVLPVFTNQTQFFVYAPLALASDTTRFSIHNSMPPPIAVPVTAEQNIASVGSIIVASGTTQLVPNSVTGTLETLQVFVQLDTSGSVAFSIQDGTGTQIAAANVLGPTSGVAYITPIDLQSLRVRFVNGLQLVQVIAGGGAGIISINLYFRTP